MQAILEYEDALEFAATEALARAVRFLEKARTADGRWLDFRFRFVVGDRDVISSQWVTAYVGQALAQAGAGPAMLAPSRDWLVSHAHPGGGWGFSLATPADADSTANVVRFLSSWRGVPEWDAALGEACAQLLRYWDEPGSGFRTYRPAERPSLNGWASYPGSSWCDIHLCVTALAGQALHAAGDARHRPVLEACARLLRDSQSPEGFWEAYWWHGRTYTTAHAARLLSLLGEDTEPVARAARWVRGASHPGGGWGNGTGSEPAAFHTALALSTLLLDGGRSRHGTALDAGLRWLLGAQQPDGSWAHVPIMRMPRPEVHAPWEDPEGCLLLPVLTDRNRLFTTATVMSALVDFLAASRSGSRGNP
jgi:squalene-hopene/tetraprenyl-beta-curcumene cyclase